MCQTDLLELNLVARLHFVHSLSVSDPWSIRVIGAPTSRLPTAHQHGATGLPTLFLVSKLLKTDLSVTVLQITK